MAEPGSFAERVKSQADIVRIVGDYVRLKKGGQNFVGLCPFHNEKTPSFAVHPVKQIYHCFGCGVGGDVFSFVMAMEKCEFPDAVKLVAEKSGIPVPRPRARTPEERREQQVRPALLELHRDAAAFFASQLHSSPEGKIARAYLEDRGLDAAAMKQFGLGYAPSSGDALLRHLKPRYNEKILEASGLVSRESGGRFYDRFRRRILFPIANDQGKIIAFGGRALGEEPPKYLNSPETPIYSKSAVLYNLDRAKDAIRRADFAVLVEGYMDAIAVFRAGITNVVAPCGTALAENQIKLITRFTRRAVVNFDPDAAGQAATERSLSLLLERDLDVRILALPAAASNEKPPDPDLFIRKNGPAAYQKLIAAAPAYVDYLISRARAMDLSSAEGKLRAVNYLMPYLQRIPNRLLRSEWATRIAAELRIEEPVLREAMRKAVAERRSEVKTDPALVGDSVKQVERRLIRLLLDASDFRAALAAELRDARIHIGLETEKILTTLITLTPDTAAPDVNAITAALDSKDAATLYKIAFESDQPGSWEEAQSCINALHRRRLESQLADVQRAIEKSPAPDSIRELMTRKQDLHRQLAALTPRATTA